MIPCHIDYRLELYGDFRLLSHHFFYTNSKDIAGEMLKGEHPFFHFVINSTTCFQLFEVCDRVPRGESL